MWISVSIQILNRAQWYCSNEITLLSRLSTRFTDRSYPCSQETHFLSMDISLGSRGVIWPSLIICTIMNPVSLTYFTQTNCLNNRDVTIARCNISWQCTQRCRDRDRTSIRVTTHKTPRGSPVSVDNISKIYWSCCNSNTMQMRSTLV